MGFWQSDGSAGAFCLGQNCLGGILEEIEPFPPVSGLPCPAYVLVHDYCRSGTWTRSA